jgi:hypothetical protein
MLANYLNECQTAGKNPNWSWDEKTLSSGDKHILQIAQNPSRMQKIQCTKQYQKQGFWETVHVIDSRSHVPFGTVMAR